jgi:tubulin-specific chaperone D
MRVSRSALVDSIFNHPQDHRAMRVLETLVTLLEDSYTDDRQAAPCLEAIAFVLEQSSELEGHNECTFPARRIWNVVRKAHFRSTNIHRLEAAVRIYGALAVQGDMRRNTLEKLKGLLLHPYPSVSRRSGTDENTSGDLTVLDKECCC